jgi:hypothetical protein
MANEHKTLRQYLTENDIPKGATKEQVALAEGLIDQYVRFTTKAVGSQYHGMATAGTNTTIIDTSSDGHLNFSDNRFRYCVVEVIAGTNVGEIRAIISSNKEDKSVTVSEAFSAAIDTTSTYVIYQLGKFPRNVDSRSLNNIHYPYIPQAVREAVVAQVKFIIQMGDSYFNGNQGDIQSESIDDYSYSMGNSNGGGFDGMMKLLSPQARMLLKPFVNRKGQMI